MKSANGLYGMGQAVDATNGQLDKARAAFTNVMNASKAYEVRQVRATSLSEDFAKRLKEQKVGLFEAARSHKLLNQVIKDQISLQKAQAVAWRKDSSGRTVADLIMPKEGLSALNNAKVAFGVLNQAVSSGAEHMVRWGKNTQWAGRQLTVGFSVPLGMAAAATGKLAYEMDKSLTNITKVYGDATTQFQDTTDTIRTAAMNTAKNMASIYGQSAKDTLEIEAQFAAAGKTGAELQQATAAATKARMLNEIDLQTAIQASITMQTVYGYSAEQLGQKWDYINAVANQTVLGAEDFAVAIPKVSGVLKEMGASLEDVGVLMTAFKSAGIDAAEGANALKTISFRAVSAYGKGLQTFTKMTGEDLNQIVAKTNGETIPTLLAMYKAMENLSTPQKIAVVKDVFGIYQGNKALILLEQLAEKSDQVAQAMAVGDNSVAENAKIANQELQRMNDQPFKKIQKALETIKIQAAELGKAVLPLAASFLQGIQGLLQWMNSLGTTQKRFALVIAAAVGLAGPLTMLLGLFANLGGNVIKLFGAFGNLITRFKIVDAQERAQILLAKQANNAWDSQTSAVARLVQELQVYNTAMAETIALKRGEAALPTPVRPASIGPGTAAAQTISKRDSAGRMQHFIVNDEGKSTRISQARMDAINKERLALGQIQAQEAERLAVIEAQNAALAAQQQRYLAISRGIGTGLAGAGLVGTMVSGNQTVQTISNIALVGGTLLSLFPKIGVSIVRGLVAPIRLMGTTATTAFKNAGLAAVNFAKAAALPIAAVAAGALIYWKKVSDAADEANKKAEAYRSSTETFAQSIGFNYTQATGVPGATKTADDTAGQMAMNLRKTNAELANQLNELGKKTGDAWGVAISEGVKVRLHGGTVDAAKEATRAALAVMGKRFSDAQFEVQINGKINFDSQGQLIREQMKTIQRDMQSAVDDLGTGADKFNRDYGTLFGGGQNDLTKSGSTLAKGAADDFFNLISGIPDPASRKRYYDQFATDTESELRKVYQQLIDKNAYTLTKMVDGKKQKKTFEEFLGGAAKGDESGLKKVLGMDDKQMEEIQRRADLVRQISQRIAENAGGNSASQREGIYSVKQAEQYLNTLFQIEDQSGKVASDDKMSKVMEAYGAAMDKASQSGQTLTEADKLGMFNRARAAQGLSYATSLADAYAYAQKDMADAAAKAAKNQLTLADAMKQVNLNPAITEDQVTGAYRNVMEGVQGDLVSAAMDSLSQEADLADQALQNQMDSAMKQFDDRSDALDKKYDAREKAMDKRHDAESKALDKALDYRKKKQTDYYDNRINGVQKLIDAEKNAEEERQKIFEAEKARIERMAEMYNKNIDFNSALNTGNLDEAAKISNDMRAQNETWMTQDAAGASQGQSDARTTALEAQKKRIEDAKQASLDALDEVAAKEKEQLAERQQNETDALKIARDGAKARLDAARQAKQKELQADQAANKAMWEDRKRNLQLELDTIRAYIPRNNAEMKKQAADIEAAYAKYGVKLQDHGKVWSGIIGTSLSRNVAKSANELKTAVNWTSIGSTISEGLIKGGFGMSAKQFAAWLNGGDAPKGSVFAPNETYKRTKQQQYQYDLRHQGQHDGGIIGKSSGSRTGHSGKNQSQSEVWVNALKGEGMLNRKATDFLGEENINALNSGKLPKNTGPWGATGVGAAIAAGATKRVMSEVLNAVATRKMMQDSGMGDYGYSGQAGAYGKVNLTKEQLNNAATIMGVGRSMGASERDLVIGIMTAMQESNLRNLNYGDADSLGLFQQRPSQGWGTAAEVTNPSYASRKFFEALLKIGDRNAMPLTMAAQAVQRSAYPMAYAKWEQMAREIVGGGALTGGAGGYMGLGLGINMSQYAQGAGGLGSGTGWRMPANGPVTSRYGMRVNPVTGQYKLHAGSDIGAGMGAAIYAAKAGRVVSAGMVSGYGNYTVIDHGGGIRTAYAHQSQMMVSPGQIVSQGQQIGKVGSTGNSTGPHLHFEYLKNGVRTNPNTIIPQLSKGGYTLNTGLANLHPKETVLTAPLTQDLHQGLDRFAKGENEGYNINMDFRGAIINKDVDIERAVESALQKREKRVGVKRRIK